MIGKRFIVDTCGTLIDVETRDTFDYVSEVVDLLNNLVNEINTYDAGNQLLKMSFDECRKENEQLKQRNTNQYNQLNELWQIIEEENWEKLISMKKQLKEDEERLQREWKCYE